MTAKRPFYSSSIFMKKMPLLSHLFLFGFLCLPFEVRGQNADFQFTLYRMDSIMADALQARLIGGGEEATQAMARMPDFVRQGRAKLEAELKHQAPDKQRASVSSSKAMHKNRDGTESLLGLQITFEPTINSSVGIVDCRMTAFYSVVENNAVKTHSLASSFVASSGVPVLLSRWQEGDVNLMLIAFTKFDSPETTERTGIRMVYVENSIFESEADAQANRNPVARAVYPVKSGNRNSSSVGFPIYYREGGEWLVELLSWEMSSEPAISEDAATISLRVGVNHKQATGGGTRAPEYILRQATQSANLKIGELEMGDMPISQRGDPNAKGTPWKLTSRCLLLELQ